MVLKCILKNTGILIENNALNSPHKIYQIEKINQIAEHIPNGKNQFVYRLFKAESYFLFEQYMQVTGGTCSHD